MDTKKLLSRCITGLSILGALIVLSAFSTSLKPNEIAVQREIERRQVDDPNLEINHYAFLTLKQEDYFLTSKYLFVRDSKGNEHMFYLPYSKKHESFYLAEPHWDRPMLRCNELSLNLKGGSFKSSDTIYCLDNKTDYYPKWDFLGHSKSKHFESMREFEFEKCNGKIHISKEIVPHRGSNENNKTPNCKH